MHVGDVRHPRQHARAVRIAQPALHVVALVKTRINGVDLAKIPVKANLELFFLADLDGTLLVDEGGVQAPHKGFVDFHGHELHLPLRFAHFTEGRRRTGAGAFREGKLR